MKTYTLSFFLVLLLPITISLAQESEKPFIVSPLIGDTLSLEERDYYNLLPTIDNFQWAVFYLVPDSTLNVEVSYLNNSVPQVTLVKHYRTLSSMRSSLHLIEHSNLENEMTCYLKSGKQMNMKILSLNNNSMTSFDLDCDYEASSNECIDLIKYSDIQKITTEEKYDNLLIGMGIGILAGAVIGAMVGNIAEPSSSSDWINSNMISTGMGAAIGAGIGLLGGIIIGIATSTPGLEIQSFSEEDIKGLSAYSRFPFNETEEIQKNK
jgi:hypothetical protein